MVCLVVIMAALIFSQGDSKYFMITFKQFIENKFEDQQFTDQDGAYSVIDLIDYAQKNKKPEEIEVKELMHNLEPSPEETGSDVPGSPEFIARAEKASLEFPILVIKYSDGLWIADGVHRLWKAVQQKQNYIKGYILNKDEIYPFKRS